MRLDAKSFLLGVVAGGMTMFSLCGILLLTTAWLMNRTNHNFSDASAPDFCPMVGDTNVALLLKPIRQKFNVPAMAAAVVTSDGLKFAGAVGVRKRGTEVPVTPDDLWHLGSDGKIMTSTLIAKMVERGQLRWDTTLAEVFPDLSPTMDLDFRQVALLQILSHHAGFPANVKLVDYLGEDAPKLRLRAVKEETAKKPLSKPGTKYLYSNLDYIVAAAVIEKITGQAWEKVIAEEIFKPLQMNSAGFGGTGTPGKIDQPWPHTSDGVPTAHNGPAMDNPPVMGPAGRIHMKIPDWAKFIQDQLRGARGGPALLHPESYQKLQTQPFGGDYALGWIVANRDWGGGKVLNHGGDNTMNCANVWVAPKKNFAILVCVNQSGDTAFEASDQAVVALMKLLDQQN